MTALLTWQQRNYLSQAVRGWFSSRDFLELDTPVLVATPGTETYLGYFSTSWRPVNNVAHPLFLRSSPELHLKRALSVGASKVFSIARCFRNEGEVSPWHHPEFTMVEWYETGLGYQGMIDQTVQCVRDMSEAFAAHFKLPSILSGLKPSVVTVTEAFRSFAGLDLIDGDPDLAKKGLSKGIPSLHATDDFETAYYKILLQCVEPELNKRTWCILKDYPPSQAALARVTAGVAERFEMYIQGIELCNAFHELTDPAENRTRFEAMIPLRQAAGKDPVPVDEAFLEATHSLPHCSGNALGFDRLLCLLQGQKDLAYAIPFRSDLPYRLELHRMSLKVNL